MRKNTYWWGEDPKDVRIVGIAILVGLIVNAIILFSFADAIRAGTPAIEGGLDWQSVRGMVGVTLGWIGFLYSVMGAQVTLKGNDLEEALPVAERSLYNSIEHGIPTLLLIWMCGLFCNSTAAVVLGGIYVFSRLLYPILYGWYGEFTMMCEFSTHLGYIPVAVLLVSLIGMVLWNDPLVLHSLDQWYQPFYLLGCDIFFLGVVWNLLGATFYYQIIARGFRWKEQMEKEGR